jgi:Xaa-Pro aminopeptidase
MRKYKAIPSELFQLNRERFMAKMKPNSIAIFQSADMQTRNGDCFFPFRQSSDLFYFCGLDQEEVVLVMYPQCPKGKEFETVVFTKKTNDYIKVWEGYKYTKEDAAKVSGVDTIMWLENMPAVLNEMILLADNVYVNGNENDRAAGEVPSRDTRIANELMAKYPGHEFLRAQPIMKELRMIKSKHEIAVMQEACNITEKAFRRVLATTKPGMMEYEVEANIIYEFIRNGASGHAYSPIVASGPAACILHYNDNSAVLKDGDVMLMDFGAEYGTYAADLSRSIPVNGRFSERQKAVYNAVLNVKKGAEQLLRPGNNLMDYHAEVGKMMESELIGLGLLSKEEVAAQNPKMPAYKKYFMHGTSHHLGLDVHDLAARYGELQEGMVFTVEPGIYIPEEGLGIRIEDDVMITNNGILNLMGNIPIEVEEIEDLMNQG